MLFDTHCHLDAAEFNEDRDDVAMAALASGVAHLLVPAVDVQNFLAVRECCQHYPGCLPAYGIHPLRAAAADEGDIARLREWLTSQSAQAFPEPMAVGEIGLDYYWPESDVFRQEYFFVEQLKIAGSMDLPVLLHVRRAVDPVLKCLRRSQVRRGIAHAFNGSQRQAEELIAMGFLLGFGGAMTYPGSARIRRLAATLPLDAIVLETDAPDSPPVWLGRNGGNRRNTPDQLPKIAAVLAELRGMPVDELIQATTTNARRCLGLISQSD